MEKKFLEECNKIFEFWKLEEYFAPLDYPDLLLTIKEGKNEIHFDRYYYNEDRVKNLPLNTYKEYNKILSKKNFKESKLYNRANLYCGCYEVNTFLRKMVETCKLNMDEYERLNKISGEFYIFSVQIDLDGKLSEEGFRISPFFYAVFCMIKSKGIKVDIRLEYIKKLDENINDILKQKDFKILQFTDINQVKKILFDKIGIDSDGEVGLKYSSDKIYACKGLKEEDESSDFSSFYLEDIEKVQNHFKENKNIIRYTTSLLNKKNKIMIDIDVVKMKEWLNADCFPLAKYPSIFSPTLMQQIAINIAVSEKNRRVDIFSVNGPPGTGKTTLLKEIIASNVEKLAEKLIDCGISGDKFESQEIDSTSTSNYKEKYYKIPKDIAKYGILVVSNNNGAVENITLDLPKAKGLKSKKTRSGYFDREEFDEVYFSQVADKLIGESKGAWGLISARMGRKSYINDVLDTCIFAKKNDVKDKITLDLAKEKSISFEEAKLNFIKAKENVLAFREIIRKDQKYLDDFYQDKEILHNEQEELKKLNEEKEKIDKSISNLTDEIEGYKIEITKAKKEIKRIKKDLSLIQKILILIGIGKLGKKVSNEKKYILEQSSNIDMNKNKISENKSEITRLTLKINEKEETISKKEKTLNKKKNAIYEGENALKCKYKNNFADNDFYKNIDGLEAAESQNACPWTFEAYDQAREELFYHALQVRKAFILESPYIKRNLFLYEAYNNGKFELAEKKEIFPHLINSLLIVIPVLSSTFASVGKFLKHAGNKSLGMLIIDESGQAVPQSALGALYRTNNAVVVGDPLQVEPVVKIPKVVIDILADSTGVAKEYKNIDNSVQLFADCINEFNGKIGERIVGCPLVVHRRCIEPMFSISNMISYENRMFNKTNNKNINAEHSFLIKKSCWIDVKGEERGGKDHFIKNQAEKVCELIEKAVSIDKKFFNEYDKLFIITPFRSVSDSMRGFLIDFFWKKGFEKEELNKWVKNCIGTVHTFQGKDADEVLFVLGCSNKSIGAMNWVVSKPNILNVACTRAKYRIAFIGNIEDWKSRKYFSDIIPKFLDVNKNLN